MVPQQSSLHRRSRHIVREGQLLSCSAQEWHGPACRIIKNALYLVRHTSGGGHALCIKSFQRKCCQPALNFDLLSTLRGLGEQKHVLNTTRIAPTIAIRAWAMACVVVIPTRNDHRKKRVLF